MPHGQPDYGMYGIVETVYRLTDIGELAARVGSIVTFDRRGVVVWLDDFEDGIEKWYKLGSPAGWSVSWDPSVARSRGFSMKLVTAASSDAYVAVLRSIPYPVLSRIGFELSFTGTAYECEVESWMQLYDGSKCYDVRVRVNLNTRELHFVNAAGSWQLLTSDVQIYPTTVIFHALKLVTDFEKSKYTRLLINNRTWVLSDYGIYTYASSAFPRLDLRLQARSKKAAAVSVWADDVILTQNEP